MKEKKCHLMVAIITSVRYICIGLMIKYPSWDKDAFWVIIHLQETTCPLILILKLKLGSTLKTRQLITILSNSSTNWHRKHSQATDLCPGKTSSLFSLLILNMMTSNLLYGQFKTIQIASLHNSHSPEWYHACPNNQASW